MNKQKFIEFIQQPDKLTTQNLSDLDELVGENPYFQAARVLEAKGNRALKTKEAGRKTASAAIYSTNRILLKKYLAGGVSKKMSAPDPKPQPIQEKPRPSSTSPTQIPVTQPTVQTPEEPDTPGTSSIDQLIYSLKKDMKDLEVSRAKYIEVARKIEEEEAVENAVKKATESAELDSTQNIRKADKPSEDTPVKETTKKKPSKSKSTGTAKSKATKKSSAASTKSAASAKSSTTKTGTSKKKPAAKKKATKAAATKTTAKKTSTKKATKAAATKSTAKKSTSRTPRSTKSSKTTKKDDTDGENQQQLIDQFIKKNPSFKPATEPKNLQDLSAESTALNENLASEYLAEIFLEQGKKDKAIKIYNSLMLRFPEKKAYFAGRIKKIK